MHSTQSLAAWVHGELLLRPEAAPFALDHAGAVLRRERLGAVRAAGIDDDDLVAESQAFQALRQLPGGVRVIRTADTRCRGSGFMAGYNSHTSHFTAQGVTPPSRCAFS
jgi:hypothetical protein